MEGRLHVVENRGLFESMNRDGGCSAVSGRNARHRRANVCESKGQKDGSENDNMIVFAF